MANAMYVKAKQAFLEGTVAYLTDTVKAALVLNTYTPNMTTHQFYSDITPGSNVIGTPQTLASKTSTSGVADAADVTFTAVVSSGANNIKYVAIYKDTGTTTTSPLIALIDTATNLPIVSNGGDIGIQWDNGANKIFALT